MPCALLHKGGRVERERRRVRVGMEASAGEAGRVAVG